jgi:hypothetical protein
MSTLLPPKKSRSMNAMSSYTTENMNDFLSQSVKLHDKIVQCLDSIRNYYVLTDEMLAQIKTFDDNTKMMIIEEYNKMFAVLNTMMTDIDIDKK